ncbi:hypothetical protein [Pelomonas sp. Root1217]|uniref:hypothetical protein n=1 Tax=Pelomonas sp. Root1217 TaxID=1736430 RepID=UPI0012FC9902|nr:hypothetical protein [Pelomonas sp. Root1217]
MDETSRAALDLLRRDDKIDWVLSHLVSSFSEGIAQSAKERGSLAQVDFQLASFDMTSKERTKREKYETSRPYEEAEKLELITFALHEVFVTLPEIQAATAKALTELGATSTRIEFDAPDDEERTDGSYAVDVAPNTENLADLRQRFASFTQKLES